MRRAFNIFENNVDPPVYLLKGSPLNTDRQLCCLLAIYQGQRDVQSQEVGLRVCVCVQDESQVNQSICVCL